MSAPKTMPDNVFLDESATAASGEYYANTRRWDDSNIEYRRVTECVHRSFKDIGAFTTSCGDISTESIKFCGHCGGRIDIVEADDE